MDKFVIKNLAVNNLQGCETDSDKPGDFLISAELSIKETADNSRQKNTVNPEDICRVISEGITSKSQKFNESSAGELAEQILLSCPDIKMVSMSIRKTGSPRGMNLDYTGIIVERQWHTAYLGIGTNLGDKIENINNAVGFINESTLCKVTNKSRIYETEPYGYLDQDKFLNGVLEVETLMVPRQLVRFLLEIEAKLKRERTIPNGPRTMDLDILFYDNIKTSFEEAVIPHPRLHERMFVLKPLCDIAPYYIHPVLNERCYRIADELRKTEQDPPEWK